MTVVPVEQSAPPHNPEIEGALLGIILVRNEAYDDVSEIVEAHHFYEPAHQRIFTAMVRLIEQNRTVTPMVLKPEFDADEGLQSVNGGQYLYDLAASVITTRTARDYARQIRDDYLRRELIAACREAIADAIEYQDHTATELIESHEARLAMAVQAPSEHMPLSVEEAGRAALDMAEMAFQNRGRVVGVPTGLVDLDEATGGMTPTNLIILAARPSMGKTALAQSICYNAAERGYKTLWFSPEMSMEELAMREHSKQSGIPNERIRRGHINMDEWAQIVQAQDRLQGIPLTIDDQPAPTIAAVRARARRHKRRHGLDLLAVDYLQLIVPSRDSLRKNSRVAEVSEISAGLKALAKELQVPVLALSQLSRSVEQRDDKRPRLSDLRESGTIEQDADAVWFLYREAYYLQRDEPRQRADEPYERFKGRYDQWAELKGETMNQAEVLIAKQRQGPVCTVKLHFDGPLMKYSNWTDAKQEDML